jgi:hypothetical protein
MNQQLVEDLAQTIRSLSPEERQLLLLEVQRDESLVDQNPDPQSLPEAIPHHPLASIIGKYEGEAWDETLAEIQRAREADRAYWQQVIDQQRDAG